MPFDRLRALPKAEVHVHLKGCFDPDVLARWAHAAGTPLPRPRERLLQFEGLADFTQAEQDVSPRRAPGGCVGPRPSVD